jgi:integrase
VSSGYRGHDRGAAALRSGNVAVGAPWADVQILVARHDTDRPADIRRRAALLLFATYGFRVGEVARLTLDDLDCEQEIICVRRSKRHNIQRYPLTKEVGGALCATSRASALTFGGERCFSPRSLRTGRSRALGCGRSPVPRCWRRVPGLGIIDRTRCAMPVPLDCSAKAGR